MTIPSPYHTVSDEAKRIIKARPIPFPVLLLAIVLLFTGCNQFRRKGNELQEQAREKAQQAAKELKQKTEQLSDKVFPVYDSRQPDTDANKKRFREHLGIPLSPDIKNIYCYGDFLGADYKVLFHFNCSPATLSRIIAARQLRRSTGHDDLILEVTEPLTWWKQARINQQVPWKAGKDAEGWQYLWYEEKTGDCWWEEFSL